MSNLLIVKQELENHNNHFFNEDDIWSLMFDGKIPAGTNINKLFNECLESEYFTKYIRSFADSQEGHLYIPKWENQEPNLEEEFAIVLHQSNNKAIPQMTQEDIEKLWEGN